MKSSTAELKLRYDTCEIEFELDSGQSSVPFIKEEDCREIHLDLSVGDQRHMFTFIPVTESGNNGYQASRYGAGKLCNFNHPVLFNPRYQAIVAHVRAEFGEPYSVDFSHLIDEDTGDRLGHWAARNHVLPKDFQQWDLADKEGTTVIELAIRSEGLPTGFKNFGMRFDVKGKEISVAEYIKAHEIHPYLTAAAGFEAKMRRIGVRNQAKAITAKRTKKP